MKKDMDNQTKQHELQIALLEGQLKATTMQLQNRYHAPANGRYGQNFQNAPRAKLNVTCYGCGKRGHYRNECRFRSQQNNQNVSSSTPNNWQNAAPYIPEQE